MARYAYGHKHKESRTSEVSDSSDEDNNPPRQNEGYQHPQIPGPLYEELQQKSISEHQDLVELKDNVEKENVGPMVQLLIHGLAGD